MGLLLHLPLCRLNNKSTVWSRLDKLEFGAGITIVVEPESLRCRERHINLCELKFDQFVGRLESDGN
jgi:hypothetical protein